MTAPALSLSKDAPARILPVRPERSIEPAPKEQPLAPCYAERALAGVVAIITALRERLNRRFSHEGWAAPMPFKAEPRLSDALGAMPLLLKHAANTPEPGLQIG
jgi:hypothetical protein